MQDIIQALQKFEELVPYGEEALMVLKAQLLIEHALLEYVKKKVPSLAIEIEDRGSPVRSGLALILLAEAVSLMDEFSTAPSDKLWPALKKLNNLRNDLAHTAYPDNNKLFRKMESFIEMVDADVANASMNTNQKFGMCAVMVSGWLAIEISQLKSDDTIEHIQ